MARLEERLAHIGTPMSLSVIGCVVNGPGEARETDIGLTGGASGHQVYLNGEKHHVMRDGDLVDHLVELVERKAAEIEAEEAALPGRKRRNSGARRDLPAATQTAAPERPERRTRPESLR